MCGYDPAGVLPYNHLIWADSKETLVETALQVGNLEIMFPDIFHLFPGTSCDS